MEKCHAWRDTIRNATEAYRSCSVSPEDFCLVPLSQLSLISKFRHSERVLFRTSLDYLVAKSMRSSIVQILRMMCGGSLLAVAKSLCPSIVPPEPLWTYHFLHSEPPSDFSLDPPRSIRSALDSCDMVGPSEPVGSYHPWPIRNLKSDFARSLRAVLISV